LAEIEWKGAVWRAAYGDHTIKELLTTLKGFGPMEILEFEKPGCFRGQISLVLSPEGKKEITVYHLEVFGPKRRGGGRAALKWLKETFKGNLYVQDPGKFIRVKNANEGSLVFWVQMFREGYIDALESDWCRLDPEMDEEQIDEVDKRVKAVLDSSLTNATINNESAQQNQDHKRTP
jgi:hypothetical protein